MNDSNESIISFHIYNKIQAIKAFRAAFSLSLKSSKNVVEALIERQPLRLTHEQLGLLMATVAEIGECPKWNWMSAGVGDEVRDSDGMQITDMALSLKSAIRLPRAIDLRPHIEESQAEHVEAALGGSDEKASRDDLATRPFPSLTAEELTRL